MSGTASTKHSTTHLERATAPSPRAWEATTVNRYTGPPMTLGTAAARDAAADSGIDKNPLEVLP
jgi:hypothetical protein